MKRRSQLVLYSDCFVGPVVLTSRPLFAMDFFRSVKNEMPLVSTALTAELGRTPKKEPRQYGKNPDLNSPHGIHFYASMADGERSVMRWKEGGIKRT